jgi:hypothetical protein
MGKVRDRIIRDSDESSLDATVARFQRELPGWWWKIMMCSISAEADTAPESDDSLSIYAAREVDERFDTGFSVELRHTAERIYTPAEALLAVLAEAKAARARYLRRC